MSKAPSVSDATSDSLVSKKARVPSCELASKKALTAALPPVGPIESSSLRLWLALAADTGISMQIATITIETARHRPLRINLFLPLRVPAASPAAKACATKHKPSVYVKHPGRSYPRFACPVPRRSGAQAPQAVHRDRDCLYMLAGTYENNGGAAGKFCACPTILLWTGRVKSVIDFLNPGARVHG